MEFYLDLKLLGGGWGEWSWRGNAVTFWLKPFWLKLCSSSHSGIYVRTVTVAVVYVCDTSFDLLADEEPSLCLRSKVSTASATPSLLSRLRVYDHNSFGKRAIS